MNGHVKGDVLSKMTDTTNIEPAVVQKETSIPIWSIGIYAGKTLSTLGPVQEAHNPVMSAGNVSDVRAEFVADPFMIKADGLWYMFFEVMNATNGKGDIGVATSQNGLGWAYQQIVLTEPFHLSYPCVIHWNGEYYMMPESHEARSLRLYRANDFPFGWSLVAEVLEGPWIDSSVFFCDGSWWLFSNLEVKGIESLELFYAADIAGPWRRHPMSPLIKSSNRIARLGGRVAMNGELPVRFAQDGVPYYGTTVRAFEVTALTVSTYAEREMEGSPVLSAGKQIWHNSGMHHIDPHFIDDAWFACVDGWRFDTPHSYK